MNEKFLLNPSASDKYTEYRVIMEQFGFSKGKFLLEFPNNWANLILDKLDANSIGELKRKKAVEKLNKFAQEMIPSEFAFSSNKSWLENAEILCEKREHAAKIITDNPGDNQIDFEDAVIFGVDSGNRSTFTFSENVQNYLYLINPIFQMSSEIFIADRYFQLRNFPESKKLPPTEVVKKSAFSDLNSLFSKNDILEGLKKEYRVSNKHMLLIEELAKIIEKHGKRKKLIILFEELKLRHNKTQDDYETLVSNDLEVIRNKYGLEDEQLTYRLVDKNVYRHCHWRLVFCTRCAIHIDAGLRFSNKGLKNSAYWVGGNDLVPHIEMFEPYFPKD